MRLLFAGTPEFALPSLAAAGAAGHEVVGVLTQPDRPAGRGRKLVASPVKRAALAAGVPVFQPETLKRDADLAAALAALAPDVAVVAAYGLLLPRWLLELPAHGCINVHASLLPRWRGAAPIARAILAGDQATGVTIMRMARGLDTGDMLLQRALTIGEQETAGALHDRLADLGGELLGQALAGLAAGTFTATPQDDALASYAPRLTKAEAALDWSGEAGALARAVRAFNPWPVAHGMLDGQPLRIWQASASDAPAGAPPGTIVAAGEAGIDVACGAGVLRIAELQWPGKRRVRAAEAARGRGLVGHCFARRVAT